MGGASAANARCKTLAPDKNNVASHCTTYYISACLAAGSECAAQALLLLLAGTDRRRMLAKSTADDLQRTEGTGSRRVREHVHATSDEHGGWPTCKLPPAHAINKQVSMWPQNSDQ